MARPAAFSPDRGEDRALLARLEDLTESASRWGKVCSSAFLSEHEQAVAGQFVPSGDLVVRLEGGYPEAQRRVFLAYPRQISQQEIDYPFTALSILLPKGYSVSHRDVLGSLMALGVKRETLGDLLIGDGLVVVFALRPAAALILGELERIGRVGVRCCEGAPSQLPAAYRLERREAAVASMRLDCIVAAAANVSRTESARLITQGMVSCDGLVCCTASREVAPGENISIRGVGKFRIAEVGGLTRKGRLHFAYDQYC